MSSVMIKKRQQVVFSWRSVQPVLWATVRCLDVNKIKLKVPTLPGRQAAEPCDRGRGHMTGGGAIRTVTLRLSRRSHHLSTPCLIRLHHRLSHDQQLADITFSPVRTDHDDITAMKQHLYPTWSGMTFMWLGHTLVYMYVF